MILLRDCSAENFIAILGSLKEAPAPENLIVSSGGGNMVETVFFSNIIKKYIIKSKLNKVFVMDECSSSALKLLFLFPKSKRFAYVHSSFLFHKGYIDSDQQNSGQLRKIQSLLEKTEKTFYDNCYLSEGNKKEIRRLEGLNTLLDAKDMVRKGFLYKKNILKEGDEEFIFS